MYRNRTLENVNNNNWNYILSAIALEMECQFYGIDCNHYYAHCTNRNLQLNILVNAYAQSAAWSDKYWIDFHFTVAHQLGRSLPINLHSMRQHFSYTKREKGETAVENGAAIVDLECQTQFFFLLKKYSTDLEFWLILSFKTSWSMNAAVKINHFSQKFNVCKLDGLKYGNFPRYSAQISNRLNKYHLNKTVVTSIGSLKFVLWFDVINYSLFVLAFFCK